MTVDKRINYEMQGGSKPARNYLGKQKTVKNIPIKWKSGPHSQPTELAYITKAEKDLILKKDLHGSLKKGANTGPDGIMSLDSQGDYTRDRSPGAYTGGGGSPNQQSKSAGTSQQALRNRAMNEQHMKEILTGQKDIGQTASVSDRVRQGAVPEWVNTPEGRKYVGSAYKDTGKRGFFSRLLGGANKYGYAPIKGLKSIQSRGTTGKGGTLGYYSDDEEVGDIKPGWGGRILGGLAGLATGIPFVGSTIGSAIDKGKGIFGKQPIDMSEFNKLSLTAPQDQKVYLPEGSDMPMASIDRWTQPIEKNIVDSESDNLFNYKDQVRNMTNFVPRNFNVNQNYLTESNEPSSIYPMAANQNWKSQLADGGRAGYENGELVEQETDFIEGPHGGEEFQETVVEGQEQPSREQLEALSMEIFQLPLDDLDEQQLLVVYQEAMQGQPMEEAVQEEDVQFAAQGGLAGLL